MTNKENNYADFKSWWFEYGSGIVPKKNDDHETHARKVSSMAWKASSDRIRALEKRIKILDDEGNKLAENNYRLNKRIEQITTAFDKLL